MGTWVQDLDHCDILIFPSGWLDGQAEPIPIRTGRPVGPSQRAWLWRQRACEDEPGAAGRGWYGEFRCSCTSRRTRACAGAIGDAHAACGEVERGRGAVSEGQDDCIYERIREEAPLSRACHCLRLRVFPYVLLEVRFQRPESKRRRMHGHRSAAPRGQVGLLLTREAQDVLASIPPILRRRCALDFDRRPLGFAGCVPPLQGTVGGERVEANPGY